MVSFVDSQRFSRFDPEDRDLLAALAKLDGFDAGEVVHSADTPSPFLNLITTGGVTLTLPTAQGDIHLGDLAIGDLFGELDAAELPAGLRHVATGDTIVYSIPRNPLKQNLRKNRSLVTRLLFAYCRSISEKLRMVNEVAVGKLAAGPREGKAAPSVSYKDRKPHLTEEQTAWLGFLGKKVKKGPGEAVVSEGDTTRSFFVVESGEVEVTKTSEAGEKQVLAMLGPNDLFGHMALVDSRPRSASVIATDKGAVCTEVDPDALERAMDLNFSVGFKFLGTMRTVLGRLFADTVRQVADLSA